MSINKKIFCLLIILIFCLGVSSASAADINSDIIASDDTAIDSGIIGEASFDENLGAESTFVVTNSTFSKYFTDGELNDNVGAGSTLDFQGTFTGVDYKVNITKPVNIISSTGDALFNEIGKKESTGGCFHISSGGSGTNVTDLSFINSAFYVTNASDVSIENIYMMANMSGVGQSTGFMCVQAGSRYVAVKDSYFENRGTGSSIIVIGYSDYCTIDNNEVFINGSSGNAVYITTYVPAKYKGTDPTGNVISNNYIHGKTSALCIPLVVAGNENTIEKNVIDCTGSGISGQSFSTQYNNTYIDNTLTGGCSFTAGENSYVSGNSVEGTMTAGSNSIVEDNKMLSLSLSKPNVVVDNNVIGEKGVTLNAAALNTTLTNNVILSKVNVKSKDNTIQKNTIEADDEYAVDLSATTATGNEVSFNNLASNNFTGDAAVNAGENNSVHDNGAMDNIVTENNFFYFFDENGNYRNLNFTELIFKGDFDSLVDAITINQTLSIEGLDASLNNMAFILLADGITLNDLKLNFDQAPVLSNGSAILIDAPNVSISEIITDYNLTESADTYAIYAVNADNLTIKDNNITFDVKNDGSAINNIIYVSDSSNVLVDSNFIFASIPSCYVSWKEEPAGSGIWVKTTLSEGLAFDECEDLIIVNNEIGIDYNDVVGAYDTLYAIDIKNSRNVDVTDNNIVALGHSYVYALYVESDGLTVENNNISSSSDNNYANGIEIEASTDAVISNNNIEVIAPSFVYPVYSGMDGGDLEVDYVGNNIYAISDIAYGMELCGSKENVIGNTITVEGNKTTALAVKSKEISIINNTINALGDNLGNSSSVDSFAAMTAGINLENSTAIVEENTINSNSRGIFVTDGEVTIENNKITVNDNGLDDSYAIIAEGPEILIDSNEITYVGATTGETVNNAICLKTCDAQVIGNDFDISIPSAYVKWVEEPAGSGIWVKLPISQGLVFEDCSDLVVDSNDIELEAISVVGAYDTIYVIDITDSDNVNVTNNNINALGHDYIYGLYIESDGAIVDANNFTIESDTNYANGIEIEASVNATISNNNIEVTAPSFAYPIYSGMNGGDLEVDYIGNNIYAVSDIVYGMELCGSEENVYENTITVEGNKTTALAIKSKKSYINKNVINALGDNLGNSSSVDSFAAMTAGINLKCSEAIVEENVINSNSRGIFVTDGEVTIENNKITVNDNGLDDSYAIIAEGSEILIDSNEITYVGATTGETVNNAICLKTCEAQVIGNDFDISIPSAYVKWVEEPAGSGNWVKLPISQGLVFEDCSDLVVDSNDIELEATSVVGAYDTIYVIDITDSDNVNVSNNNINALGHDYIYGLYIESNGGVVDANKFTIESDTNYANGIEIEASVNATISNNNIDVTSPKVAYPVYSGMNGGDLEVDYIGNKIDATSDIVYGMELSGSNEYLTENLIRVNGNKTTALAVKSKEAEIFNNIIWAFGENLRNSTTTDSFAPMTAAVHLMNSNASVNSNMIASTSKGILVESGEAEIGNNSMVVKNNGLDDSYAIMAENAGIVIGKNNITFEGNGNGSKKNKAVYLKDCNGPEVSNNRFDITLPSCYVDWQEVPPGSGNWVSDPMSEGILIDSPNAVVKENDISVGYEGVFGDYDTIYAVHVNSDNGTFASNTILAQGHSYIYGLEVSGNDFVVENNNITSISDAMYANGIDVEGVANGVVKDNIINVYAPGVTYGIYSSMSNGNVSVDYLDNEIISVSPSAYGMELMGLKENVEGNTFTINGTDAIAIYSSSKDVTVKDNIISVDADDIGLAFLGRSGNATITDNEVQVSGEYTIDVSQITSLVKDNYLIADNLTGDASVDYDPETSSVYNNTPKMDKYFLSTDGLEKYFGNSEALEFMLFDSLGNPAVNKTITITVNGKDYTRKTDANGTARMSINLNAGNYTATASYENQSVDADITILSTIESKDLTKMFRNATQYEATFVDTEGKILKNTDVSFNINGVFYTRKTNENGTAKLNINLEPGEYIITATNPVTSEQASNKVTVLSTITDNNNLIKYYRNDTQYTVKLLDSQGNAVGAGEMVTFNINGVFYNRTTNASGIAKLNINLEPGNYVITADYNGCRVSNNITVLSTLKTKDMSMKYKDGSKFEATVLDGQGNPYPGQNVTFNINGMMYTRLSDSNGVSRLNINLMPGTYIITSSYNKLNVSNKITISS